MLISHVRPSELWGKKVYDTEGRLLGEVVAIGSRRGVVRKVLVLHRVKLARPISVVTPPETRVDAETMVVPVLQQPPAQPRLRLVR